MPDSFWVIDSEESWTDSCVRVSECYSDINDSTAFDRGSDADPDQQVASLDRRKAESGLDWPCQRKPRGLRNTEPDASIYNIKGYNHRKSGLTSKLNKSDMTAHPFQKASVDSLEGQRARLDLVSSRYEAITRATPSTLLRLPVLYKPPCITSTMSPTTGQLSPSFSTHLPQPSPKSSQKSWKKVIASMLSGRN